MILARQEGLLTDKTDIIDPVYLQKGLIEAGSKKH